jgi:Rieske Fe-S protein
MRHENVRSRREFLSMLTTIASAGAVLSVSPNSAQAAPETTEPLTQSDTQTAGYQRTEHVDTYYRLADF